MKKIENLKVSYNRNPDGTSYNVKFVHGVIESGLIGEEIKRVIDGSRNVCVVTDTNVDGLYSSYVEKSLNDNGFKVCKYVFEAGEKSKNTSEVNKMYGCFSENGLTREDAVVALGGGVTGDMGSFAASTYLRGIRSIQIPTSTLAAIDSSVGGKVGVDTEYGKNLAGTFHDPVVVLCDTAVFRSLPEEQYASGLVEAVKMGIIGDKELFRIFEEEEPKEYIDEIVYGSVKLKAEIVAKDPNDHGIRGNLNLGHTLGHAYETLSNYELSHGFAVGIGMIELLKAQERNGDLPKGTVKRCEVVLKKIGAMTEYPKISLKDVIDKAFGTDKKRLSDGRVKFVMPKEIGEMTEGKSMSKEECYKYFGIGRG